MMRRRIPSLEINESVINEAPESDKNIVDNKPASYYYGYWYWLLFIIIILLFFIW